MNEELLARYGDVIVRVGCNIQPGQPLFVYTNVNNVEVARAVAEAGWKAGAGDVQMLFYDDYERYLLARYGSDEMLTRSNVARLGFLRTEYESQAASVNIIGDLAPPIFADADDHVAVPGEQLLVHARRLLSLAACSAVATPPGVWSSASPRLKKQYTSRSSARMRAASSSSAGPVGRR